MIQQHPQNDYGMIDIPYLLVDMVFKIGTPLVLMVILWRVW